MMTASVEIKSDVDFYATKSWQVVAQIVMSRSQGHVGIIYTIALNINTIEHYEHDEARKNAKVETTVLTVLCGPFNREQN